MTTLSPVGGSSRRRSSAVPVVMAVVAALAIGLVGGWWFAGRGQGSTTASSTSTSTCHSSGSTASAHASSTGSTRKPTGKPTGKPTKPPAAALPLPRTITVNVYNATTRTGLALSTSLELAARGFKTGSVANDPAKKIIAASAEVRYGPSGAVAAKVVAAQVIGAVMVPDHRKDASVDFVLGDGYVALASPQQAAATLATITAVPTPSATSTEC
jgi:hypothetical protein